MTEYDVKNRILEKAQEHFLRYGFSTVTMSEIATELGMSKKTVYTHFQSKEDLASEMVKRMQDDISCQINALVDDHDMDFIEKLKRILQITAIHHNKLTPHFRMDLQKHAPHVCKCTDDFQRNQIHSVVSRVIRQGVDKGAFRLDLDEALMTTVFIASFQALLKPEFLAQEARSVSKIFDALRKIIFEGIMTDEARLKMHASAINGLALPS